MSYYFTNSFQYAMALHNISLIRITTLIPFEVVT